MSINLIVCACLFAYSYAGADDEFLLGSFPDDFGWGACSSAYQTEGYVHALRMTFPYFHFNWVGFNNRGLPSSFQAPSVW
jgi:hypothetical protein